MANKTTANAFMASAQKSKREMADIQKEGSGKHETDEVELKKISLLIPAWLHKEAQGFEGLTDGKERRLHGKAF